jgi:hypothetical protein
MDPATDDTTKRYAGQRRAILLLTVTVVVSSISQLVLQMSTRGELRELREERASLVSELRKSVELAQEAVKSVELAQEAVARAKQCAEKSTPQP